MTLTSREHGQDMNLRRLTDWHATDDVRDNLKLCVMAAEKAGNSIIGSVSCVRSIAVFVG